MSDKWYTEFNAVFFTGIATMAFGALAVLCKYLFVSKCDNVSICFDFIKIHRAVELEVPNIEEGKEDEDDLEIQNEEKDNIPKNS
jgi:hypothetical protein